MLNYLPHFFIAFLVFFPLFEVKAADQTDCEVAIGSIQSASRIRGLQIKKRVPCFTHDKDQVRNYLIDAITQKVPAQKMLGEEKTYKALGLIPQSFDYKQGLVKMYTDQLSGYYDPEKKYYVMAAWLPAMLQTTVAVHELTHALQDQHFNLNEFVNLNINNSDTLLARSALVEGDATAVMIDFSRTQLGLVKLENEKNVNDIMFQNVMGMTLLSGMTDVPESLQKMLVFPYVSGLRFVHGLLVTGGYKVIDQAFKNPPNTTEEILHPEKFAILNKKSKLSSKNNLEYQNIEVAKASFTNCATQVAHQDVLGEFGISALLSMYEQNKTNAAIAAAGWAGDRVALYEKNQGCSAVVVWKTAWDTKNDAEEFFASMQKSLAQRFPNQVDRLKGIKKLNNSKQIELSIKDQEVLYALELD